MPPSCCSGVENGKKEFLSRVFLPFEQETAEIAQHFGGTGLGLAITDRKSTRLNSSH